jgi:hypothetical protein
MDEAYVRSSGIFNPSLARPVNIVGCGSIGSFLSMGLVKCGFKVFHLYDEDIVDVVNVGCQNFGHNDIGKPKVEALKEIISNSGPKDDGISIIAHNEFVGPGMDILRLPTFVGVDSMIARKNIWKKLKNKIPILVDGRIGGEFVRVFSVRDDYTDVEFYESTLYSDEDASELPCTERNVIDVAFFVAAMMIRAMRTFLSKGEVSLEAAMDVKTFTSYTIDKYI